MKWSHCRLIVLIAGLFCVASPAVVNSYAKWSEHEVENLISREAGWAVAGVFVVITSILSVWPIDGERTGICITAFAVAVTIVLDIIVDTVVPMMLSRSAVLHVFDIPAFVAAPVAIINCVAALIVVVRRRFQM